MSSTIVTGSDRVVHRGVYISSELLLLRSYRSQERLNKIMETVVELSRQMSSCKDLVVEPSQLGSLKGLSGTRNMRIILVRPLTVKVKAYSS